MVTPAPTKQTVPYHLLPQLKKRAPVLWYSPETTSELFQFCLILQMTHKLIAFFTKILLLFFIVSTLSLPNRCSADASTETERTLAIIKPDGVSGNYTKPIKETILDHGFKITEELFIQLDEDHVKSFYAEHSSRSFFPSLVEHIASGPVLIMVLEKGNAIADWRALIGPTDPLKAKVTHPYSVRAICGLDLQKNCVHGSDSPQSAAREISFFFERTSSGHVSKHDEL